LPVLPGEGAVNHIFALTPQDAGEFFGRPMRIVCLVIALLWCSPAFADLRITRDFGGYVEAYKAKYAKLRDHKQRVIVDGICNSACTLVLGIVPLNRICVTPRASLGFHQAYYDKRWTAGLRVTSLAGTDELMSYYPPAVKAWIARQGGLTAQMKRVVNGSELWAIIDPCPEEFPPGK
jgi:hypothetical protein